MRNCKDTQEPSRVDRLTTDLPFEEAVKRLLNTPPPPKEKPTRTRRPTPKNERKK